MTPVLRREVNTRLVWEHKNFGRSVFSPLSMSAVHIYICVKSHPDLAPPSLNAREKSRDRNSPLHSTKTHRLRQQSSPWRSGARASRKWVYTFSTMYVYTRRSGRNPNFNIVEPDRRQHDHPAVLRHDFDLTALSLPQGRIWRALQKCYYYNLYF